MLGDWFATVLFWRPQLALYVNATTLLPVFMPLAPAATVPERLPDTLAVVLNAHGIADRIIDHEVAETAEQRLAKTNRSIVGVMTEFARLADSRRDEITRPRRPDPAITDARPDTLQPAVRPACQPGP